MTAERPAHHTRRRLRDQRRTSVVAAVAVVILTAVATVILAAVAIVIIAAVPAVPAVIVAVPTVPFMVATVVAPAVATVVVPRVIVTIVACVVTTVLGVLPPMVPSAVVKSTVLKPTVVTPVVVLHPVSGVVRSVLGMVPAVVVDPHHGRRVLTAAAAAVPCEGEGALGRHDDRGDDARQPERCEGEQLVHGCVLSSGPGPSCSSERDVAATG